MIVPALVLIAGLVGCQGDESAASATDGDEPGTSEVAAESSGALLPTTGPAEETTSGGTAGGTATGEAPWTSTGDEPPGCDQTADPLCAVPPEEMEPTEKPDGIPGPKPGVYDDQGPAQPDAGVRALFGFPTRDRATLEALVEDMYDPGSPDFRRYLSVEEWMAAHAPPAEDVALVAAWLTGEGFSINWTAGNRMLIHFSGTAERFNEVFQTELHVCMRKNPMAGQPPFPVYCALEDGLTLPKFVADRTTGVLTADLPAEVGMLSNEGGAVQPDPPGPGGFGPKQIAGAYGVKPLYEAGQTGQGSSIGVIAAGTYHAIDLQIFWASFGVERKLPTRVSLLEPPHERITETIVDVQWSSVMAPGADMRVYEGPDARNTSLLFVWNEAIWKNEVDVITNSFAHREDSEPAALRHQYDESALMAASLGITLLAAGGNSARPDTPSGSPYVTSTGGTRLKTDDDGNVLSEVAWSSSGSGDTLSFPIPYWQQAEAQGETRAVSDIALNASPGTPYWVRRYGEWVTYGGTSFASPVMSGLVAVINGKRKAEGKPRVGWLNPTIYLEPPVRTTFRDITEGATDLYAAGTGWDYPTGLGAPNAAALADALP